MRELTLLGFVAFGSMAFICGNGNDDTSDSDTGDGDTEFEGTDIEPDTAAPEVERDPNDTFCYDCSILTSYLEPLCDDGGTASTVEDDTVSFAVGYTAWASQVSVELVHLEAASLDAAMRETHRMSVLDNVDYDIDGEADHWELELYGALPANQAAGSSTAFTCSQTNYWDVNSEGVWTELTAKVTAVSTDDYDTPSSTCVMFGNRSASYFAGDNCECFEEFLTSPPANPCGER